MSLLEFIVTSQDISLENKILMMSLLLKKGAIVSSLMVSKLLSCLSISHLELAAMLLFSLPRLKWSNVLSHCRESSLKENLLPILSMNSLFHLLKHKKFTLFSSALRVCCLKNLDIFSLNSFDINDFIPGKHYNFLHFSTYHLSCSSTSDLSKKELGKVVKLLLDLGANPSITTKESSIGDSSSTSECVREFSSLSLLTINYKNPTGEIIPESLHLGLIQGCVSRILEKHPLQENGELPSKEEVEKISKRAAVSLLSKTAGPRIKIRKIDSF